MLLCYQYHLIIIKVKVKFNTINMNTTSTTSNCKKHCKVNQKNKVTHGNNVTITMTNKYYILFCYNY